jgi:hypothetical protein
MEAEGLLARAHRAQGRIGLGLEHRGLGDGVVVATGLEHEDLHAAHGERVGGLTAAGAGTDDDDVIRGLEVFFGDDGHGDGKVWLLGSAELPGFVEEAGGRDGAGRDGVGGDLEVDDGPIRQLGDLAGVVEVVVFAVGEATIDHDVLLRVQRIRIDEDRGVIGGGVGLAVDDELISGPLDRELGDDLGEQRCSKDLPRG